LDGKLLEVALMKLAGYTNAEIAAKRERSEKTVERYLKMIRARWTE
jgi:DNA-binding CsgD family transcriptional regulator